MSGRPGCPNNIRIKSLNLIQIIQLFVPQAAHPPPQQPPLQAHPPLAPWPSKRNPKTRPSPPTRAAQSFNSNNNTSRHQHRAVWPQRSSTIWATLWALLPDSNRTPQPARRFSCRSNRTPAAIRRTAVANSKCNNSCSNCNSNSISSLSMRIPMAQRRWRSPRYRTCKTAVVSNSSRLAQWIRWCKPHNDRCNSSASNANCMHTER